MDLKDPWDSKYCLAKFNGFKLHSTSASSDAYLATIFQFTDPKKPDVNPTVTLIAEANQVVKTQSCTLSNEANTT